MTVSTKSEQYDLDELCNMLGINLLGSVGSKQKILDIVQGNIVALVSKLSSEYCSPVLAGIVDIENMTTEQDNSVKKELDNLTALYHGVHSTLSLLSALMGAIAINVKDEDMFAHSFAAILSKQPPVKEQDVISFVHLIMVSTNLIVDSEKAAREAHNG